MNDDINGEVNIKNKKIASQNKIFQHYFVLGVAKILTTKHEYLTQNAED
jgi:hypothetical protein